MKTQCLTYEQYAVDSASSHVADLADSARTTYSIIDRGFALLCVVAVTIAYLLHKESFLYDSRTSLRRLQVSRRHSGIADRRDPPT